jgi:predicted RNA binding protein YcfA (HicA-like mRNA interferase family)
LGRLKLLGFREIKRPLETAGFREVGQKGSHVDTAIVPRKHEVPVGTLRSILNQAHIEPESWDRL